MGIHMLNVYRSRNFPQITVLGDAPSPRSVANKKMEERAFLRVHIHEDRKTWDLLLSPKSKFEVLEDGSILFEGSNFWVFSPDNQRRGQKRSFGKRWLKLSITMPPRHNGWIHLVGIYSDKGSELYRA